MNKPRINVPPPVIKREFKSKFQGVPDDTDRNSLKIAGHTNSSFETDLNKSALRFPPISARFTK